MMPVTGFAEDKAYFHNEFFIKINSKNISKYVETVELMLILDKTRIWALEEKRSSIKFHRESKINYK